MFDKGRRRCDVWGRVHVVSVALLACACGNDQLTPSDGASGGTASTSGGSSTGGQGETEPGSGGRADSGGTAGTSDGGSGGQNSTAKGPCRVVDGKLAYGPIGEPYPWPLETISISGGDCSSCDTVQDYAVIPRSPGYRLVWRMGYGDAPEPNLFGMTLGAQFEASEPVALTEKPVTDFQVAEAASGLVVSTCSADLVPRWIWLTNELEAASSPSFAFEGAKCITYEASSVLWTGKRYLTSFTDARGLVLASLDEQGTLVREEILTDLEDAIPARFSQNGDRVLVVFNAGAEQKLRYQLLDLEGTPLEEAESFGVEVDTSRTRFLITTKGDGWWVMNDTGSSSDLLATLTQISRDGRATTGDSLGELSLRAFAPSHYGGSLLLTRWSEDDLHGHSFSRMNVLSDAGEVAYSVDHDFALDGPFPEAIIPDPERDLIVEDRRTERGLGNQIIQAYGCLE